MKRNSFEGEPPWFFGAAEVAVAITSMAAAQIIVLSIVTSH